MSLRLIVFTLALLMVGGAAGAWPSAAEPGCIPSCEVPALTFAFVPPVVVAESGATLRWSSLDGLTHTANDAAFCFYVPFSDEPGKATFRIAEGKLLAKVGERERACGGATAMADGSFRLPYVCNLHPMMVGELVVRPHAAQVS